MQKEILFHSNGNDVFLFHLFVYVVILITRPISARFNNFRYLYKISYVYIYL